MHAVPLLCLALTVGELREAFAGLPPHDFANRQYQIANAFVDDLQRWQRTGGGIYANRLSEVLDEARPLAAWWGAAADATSSYWYSWETRLERAQFARRLHDWRHYGWPPAIPFWRLPHR